MKQQTILVTGGAGFVGSVCVELLVAQGYNVIVLDNLQTGNRRAVHPKARLVRGSIGNARLLQRLFTENSVSAVVHFAAETLVTAASTDPHRYVVNNLQHGITLLNALREHGCQRIVFSSTAAVYGEPISSPLDENHPTAPLNAYGETKLMFERLLQRYREAYGLQAVVFRYFNAAGASAHYGEQHMPETHLLPLILQTAVGRRASLDLFGEDYETEDGTCVRDYVHVLDIAGAHVLALAKIDSLSANTFNLGNGTGFSVRAVVQAAERITGRKVAVSLQPRRPGDPARLVAAATRAQQVLGWQPKHSALDNIISSAWHWMQQHPRGYR